MQARAQTVIDRTSGVPKSHHVNQGGIGGLFPRPRSLRVGHVLYRQGEAGSDLFHVTSGFIKLIRLQPNGKEAIVGLRTGGRILGAAAVLLDEPHVATAIAATSCAVAQIEAGAFRQLLKSNRDFSDAVHRMHSRETHDQLVELSELSCCSAKDRLAMLLSRLGNEMEPTAGRPTRLPLRQWELAQLVGVAPQYLSQLLTKMRCDRPGRQAERVLVATKNGC